jgi:hypothetical protein
VRAPKAYYLVTEVHHPTELSQSTQQVNQSCHVRTQTCSDGGVSSDKRLPFNVSPVVETDIPPVQMMSLYPNRFLPAVTREEVYHDCCCLSGTEAHYYSTFLSQA